MVLTLYPGWRLQLSDRTWWCSLRWQHCFQAFDQSLLLRSWNERRSTRGWSYHFSEREYQQCKSHGVCHPWSCSGKFRSKHLALKRCTALFGGSLWRSHQARECNCSSWGFRSSPSRCSTFHLSHRILWYSAHFRIGQIGRTPGMLSCLALCWAPSASF